MSSPHPPAPPRLSPEAILRQLRHRWRRRRSGLSDAADPHGPEPHFSAALYRAANPDVAASGIDPLLHYLLDGWAQGRPLRPGPHAPPMLPPSGVLGLSERIRAGLRHVRPRCRELHPQAGPDPAATIAVQPSRGAMPTGWCLIGARGDAATLLVRSGGATYRVAVPAEPATPALVRLPDVPAQLALQRPDRSGPQAAPRPIVTVCELGAWAQLRARRPSSGIAEHGLEDASSYAAWVARYDTPSAAQLAHMAARAGRLDPAPTFSVVAHPPDASAETLASLAAQLYPHWQLCREPSSAAGAFTAFLDSRTVLAPHALLLIAEAIAADPQADLLYADQDRLVAGARQAPWFKPDFSPELARHVDLFSIFGVVRTSLLRDCGATGPSWHTLADVSGRRVVHIPHVLAHAAAGPPAVTPRSAADADRAMAWPTVTAIVPTRDHAGVLRACLEGLLDGTDYPALDIIVADNGSTEAETVALFDHARGQGAAVLPCPGPFNYAAINNRAAATARGELLLFLNNDISISQPGWLKQMVRLTLHADVGAVGAKLLYPDGTLQHGGVVLGMGGVAGHVHLGVAGDDPGYFGRLHAVQEVAAVTAACMVVPARHFTAIGGFDADHLAVAFNDIDLCLRLRQAGLRILWTPHAVLNHWESKSRGSDFSPERLAQFTAEIAYMQTRWSDELVADPFYSPNLSLESTEPAPAFPPRGRRPWE